MIHLKKVSKVYATKGTAPITAIQELDLCIPDASFVVITGRSGSGKTTLLNLIASLTKPTSGCIELDGTNLWSLSDREQALLRNTRIGFVFQFPSLLPSLTVLENVMLPSIFGAVQQSSEEIEGRARELLAMTKLSEKCDCLPRQLSAGQQQRVVIARSVINKPQFLIADEPTSNLDQHTEAEIMDLFREIHLREQLTVVMVTHNHALGAPNALQLELEDGRLIRP